MTRHEIRKEIFKAIFQKEFYKESSDVTEAVDFFLENRDIAEEEDLLSDNKNQEDREYVEKKAKEILSLTDELDEKINKASDNWKCSRMNKVDLSLLRLALYEMSYEKIDAGIAINEAVNLADEFGTDNSKSFVNGVLAKLSRQEN